MNDIHPVQTEDTAPVVGHDISHTLYDQVVEILQEQQNFLLSGYKTCVFAAAWQPASELLGLEVPRLTSLAWLRIAVNRKFY